MVTEHPATNASAAKSSPVRAIRKLAARGRSAAPAIRGRIAGGWLYLEGAVRLGMAGWRVVRRATRPRVVEGTATAVSVTRPVPRVSPAWGTIVNTVSPQPPSPQLTAPTHPDVADPRLAAAVDVARKAAEVDAAEIVQDDAVGKHVAVHPEGHAAATHLFEANYPGYRGWRWAVTVSTAGPDEPVTVSEVVLLPGPDALVAPEWVPWDQRVRAGDLGVGDLLPAAPDDPRLVPGYVETDDPVVDDVVPDIGLGRPRVLSREGRLDAAQRWQDERGPSADMAASAPGSCGTCGFYLPLAGSLGAAFGACANEFAPADGKVVHAEFGCGAHSEVDVEPTPLAPVAEVVYDDAQLDVMQAPQSPPPPAEVSAAAAAGEPWDAQVSQGELWDAPVSQGEPQDAHDPGTGVATEPSGE